VENWFEKNRHMRSIECACVGLFSRKWANNNTVSATVVGGLGVIIEFWKTGIFGNFSQNGGEFSTVKKGITGGRASSS